MSSPVARRLGAPAVRRLSAPPAVRRLGARAARKLSAPAVRRLVIARDGVGGRALNDEIVVIINDDDKLIFISVCC